MQEKGVKGTSALGSMANSRPFVIVIVVSIVLFLVYEIWTVENERRELASRAYALSKELAVVMNHLEVKDRKLLIVERKQSASESQVKEISNQLSDCKKGNNDAAKNAEKIRQENDEYRKKAKELQEALDSKMEMIRKLVQSNDNGQQKQQQQQQQQQGKTSPISIRTTLSGICNIWMGQSDTNSLNGIARKEHTTLSGCQRYCIDTPECVGIDFDNASVPNPTCWVHLSEKDLLSMNTYRQVGTTQHKLNRKCLEKKKS